MDKVFFCGEWEEDGMTKDPVIYMTLGNFVEKVPL